MKIKFYEPAKKHTDEWASPAAGSADVCRFWFVSIVWTVAILGRDTKPFKAKWAKGFLFIYGGGSKDKRA